MASVILETLTSRRNPQHAPYPAECFGDYVGTLNYANHCWVAEGSVRETFDSELEPELARCLAGWTGSVASKDRITLTKYMVGVNERIACPTVLFICQNASLRKKAKQMVKESGIFKQFPRFRIVYVTKDPAYGGGRLLQLASGQGTEQSDAHIEAPVTEVFYDRRNPLQSIGMPIYIKHCSSMRAATANAIHLEGHTFYIAPSHAFFSREQALDADALTPETEDDDFEFDSDSEFAHDEVLAMITSIASQSPNEWHDDESKLQPLSDSFPSIASYSTPTFDISSRADMVDVSHTTEKVISKLLPFSKVEAKFLPRETAIPSSDCLATLGVLADWSVDQDWALVEVKEGLLDIQPIEQTALRGLSNVPLAPMPQENTMIIAYTASGGRMTGTMTATSSYTRVPRGRSFQKVLSVKLDGPLADGDCGSAVFDASTGAFFGHIVAGCRETGFAQVMAGQNIIPQVKLSVPCAVVMPKELASNLDTIDPASITCSVVELVSFALSSTTKLADHVHTFQEHDKRTLALKRELSDLTGVLDSLLEICNVKPDINFDALKSPLDRCGHACKEYGELVARFTKRSNGTAASIRSWVTQRYLQGDVTDFKDMLAGYRATINMAVANVNIRVAAITPKALEGYRNMMSDTTQDLQQHLHDIEGKIQALSRENSVDCNLSSGEWTAILAEKKCTQQGLDICVELSAQIDMLEPMVEEWPLSTSQPEAQAYVSHGLGATKASVFEDITLADQSFNFTISTVGDLVTARKINLSGGSCNIGDQLTEAGFDKAREALIRAGPQNAEVVKGDGRSGFQSRHGRGKVLNTVVQLPSH